MQKKNRIIAFTFKNIFYLRTSAFDFAHLSLSMCEVFYLNKTVAVTRDRAVDVEDVILGVHPPYLPEKRP